MLTEETTPTRANTITVERVLSILLRRVGVIILVTVVITGSAVGFSLYQTPTYQATVKMLVSQKNPGGPNLGGDIAGLQEVTLTVARAVPTQPVAQRVVEQLNQPELSAGEVLANMSVEPDPGTMFINISYEDSDPQRAQLIANTVAETSSQKISDVMLGANPIVARIWQPATLPENPVSPNPERNGIIALLLGGLLGVGLAFLLEYVEDSWTSPEEVEEVSGVPTFGVIPAFAISPGKRVEFSAVTKEGDNR
jgi:capsular polysaccharide biosynthesis protein